MLIQVFDSPPTQATSFRSTLLAERLHNWQRHPPEQGRSVGRLRGLIHGKRSDHAQKESPDPFPTPAEPTEEIQPSASCAYE